MADKIKVFISYNHKDVDLLNKLLVIMGRSSFVNIIEPKYDVIITDNPTNLYGTISKLLNKSHIALAIITNNWLQSNNTRDEFTRAHERRKMLYCLFKDDDEINEKNIPFFIKGDLRYEFDEKNFDQRAIEICNSILQFKNHWQLKVFDRLRKIGDIIETEGRREDSRKYTIGHFDRRMERTSTEMENLIQKSFSINVSYEQNFLETAKPYFENASRIFAVSLINVSTFWTDNKTPNYAKKSYLKAHNGENREIVRLFVFSEPHEVNYFKNVLQANYNEYGRSKEKGGVLLCSYSKYEALVNKWFWGDLDHISNIKRQDFGLLSYQNSENSVVHETILSNGQMSFKEIDLSSSEFESRNQFINDLQKKEADLEKLGIIKWEDKFYENQRELSYALQRIFSNNIHSKEVVHSVYFKINDDIKSSFEAIINRFQNIIEKKKESYQINWVYFRNRIDKLKIIDANTGGKLKLSRQFNYSFTLVFKNQYSLLQYYSDEIHSSIRRELYTLLNPETISHYNDIDRFTIQKNLLLSEYADEEEIEEIEKHIEAKYKVIENLIIDNYALRTDWENNSTFDSIVGKKGYKFLDYDI